MLLYIISFLQFLLPLKDLIVKKDPKWYRRISSLGWILICTGILSTILTYRSQEKKSPLLNVFEGPRFQNRTADSIPIAMSIKNFGKATAKNIEATIISIDDYGTPIVVTNDLTEKSSNEKFITEDGVYAYYMNFDINKFNSIAKTYIYFRVSYSTEDGIPIKDTIKEIYRIPSPVNSSALIFDAKLNEFNRIKEFLVTKKLW